MQLRSFTVTVYLKWVLLLFSLFLLFRSSGQKNSTDLFPKQDRESICRHIETDTISPIFFSSSAMCFHRELQTFDIFRKEDLKFDRKFMILPGKFLQKTLFNLGCSQRLAHYRLSTDLFKFYNN